MTRTSNSQNAGRKVRFVISSALGRAFAGSLIVASLARVIQLSMAILLARQLGPSGYGTFTFALGVAVLAAQFASLGWPMLMARFIPQYAIGGEWALLRGLVRASDGIVLLATLAATLAIYASSFLAFVPSELAAGMALAALLTAPTAFRLLRRQQFASVKKPALGLGFDELFAPLLVVTYSLIFGTNSAQQALVIYGSASAVAVIVATILLKSYLPQGWNSKTPEYRIGMWMGVALPMMVGLSSKVLMNRTDVIMLAPLSNFEEVGLYGAAFRITYLLTFPQVVLMTIITPILGEAIAEQNRIKLVRYFAAAVGFAAITVIPLAFIVWAFRDVLAVFLFGEGFIAAATPLAILTAAQAVTGFNLCFSALLLMAAKHRIFGLFNVICLLVNIALNLLFIPQYGALGASWATLAATCILLIAQLTGAMMIIFPRNGTLSKQ